MGRNAATPEAPLPPPLPVKEAEAETFAKKQIANDVFPQIFLSRSKIFVYIYIYIYLDVSIYVFIYIYLLIYPSLSINLSSHLYLFI